MSQFKRVWHPYHKWEEVKFNMWGGVKDAKKMLRLAISFTGDHISYGAHMKRVVEEWPISCENALTDSNLNRRAWIGHAACSLAINCPEDITRKAWKFLSDEQRFLANREAARAIREWEKSYRKNRKLSSAVGEQMLFNWNSR